jgi:hypothetical protein
LINAVIMVCEAGYLSVTNVCRHVQLHDITEGDQKTSDIPFRYTYYVTLLHNYTEESHMRG